MRLFRRKALPQAFSVKHASFLYGIGAARWLERDFQKLATEGYEKNPIVYACVSKLAKALSSVDLQLYRKRRNGNLEKIERHPLLDLLAHPNPTMGGRKFLEAAATNYLVGGNAYILGGGANSQSGLTQPPDELWLLPTQAVNVKADARSFLPAYYEYRPGQMESVRYAVDRISGRSAVLHLKTVNLLNPLVGLPPMVAAAYGVDVFNSGQEWNKALLDNDARPAGALEIVDSEGKPVDLTDEQRSRLQEMLARRFSGKQNAGMPIVLEGGLKWVPMSMTPKDMDHRENILTNARFIAGVFHTPPQLVNIPGESTYSNYAEAKLAYWADTVLPLLGALLEDINNWLPPLYADDLFLWYDEEMIPALEPTRKAKSDRINASTFMSINEKRRAMGWDDDPHGNVILVPSGMIPLELAGAMDLPEPESPTEEPEEAPEEEDEA